MRQPIDEMIGPLHVHPVLRLWPQWTAAFVVCLLSVSLGLVAGWTSPYLAQLTSEDSPIPITKNEASWVASLVPLGRLFGAILGSMAVEYLGSKTSLLLSGFPLLIGWISIICADSATWLYVSRTFSGASMGMIFSCFPLYMGEISSPSIRGALVCFILNGMPLGTLIGNTMGAHLSIMWFGIISLILNVCYIAIFPFLPDSPHYFVRRNELDKAEKAIRWYHRKSDVAGELEDVENFVRSSTTMNFRERLKMMCEPKNRRAFATIMLLFIFMQLSGLNSIVFYMEIIIRNAKVTCISASSVVIIVSTIGITMGWISVYLIDKCGRRILLAISSCGVILGMFLLGLHFMLLGMNYDPLQLEWLPILSLIVFMMMCIGIIPVPSTLLSEIFPSDLKSVAGFVGSVTSAIFAFVSSKTYQPLLDLMTEKYVFWLYGSIMCVNLVFSLTQVMETKGKTLQEIQEMLAGEGQRDESQQESQQEGNAARPRGNKT